MNQSIHTIDLLVWMLGDPVEVFAYTDCLAHRGIEVEDTAAATIRFANGALGVVHGTTAAYPGLTAHLQVHGDRGSAVIDNDDLTYFHAAETAAEAPSYGADGDGNQAELPQVRKWIDERGLPVHIRLLSGRARSWCSRRPDFSPLSTNPGILRSVFDHGAGRRIADVEPHPFEQQ